MLFKNYIWSTNYIIRTVLSFSIIKYTGGLSVAIPGEIKGYWEIYKKFGGHLPWKELFSPTISLCESGIPINKKLEKNIKQYEDIIKSNEEFR